MKILVVVDFFKPFWSAGGIARVSYDISRRLVDMGHEVTVYSNGDGRDSPIIVEKNQPTIVDGMTVYYFKNLFRYLAKKTNVDSLYLPPIIAKRELKEFDIIHVHTFRSIMVIPIWYYAKKYNIPYILQAHGSVLPFFQKQCLKKIFDLFFGYRILRDASKIIASTKIEAEQYKKMGVDEGKIEIVPNGIDLSELNLPERGEFRKKYKIKDEKIILYLGRIHKIKGIDLLMKAFVGLIKEMGDVRLVIVGQDDGFLSTLKRQIEDLKIGDKILLTGPIPEKDKLGAYVDADVYVLPSVYETFPVTVLEACACGTPVIVTDRCGIANIVNNNNVGYVVEYNKDQLQDAIFKILINEELRRYFGEGGKKLVREKFSWDIVVEQLEKIYGDIICI